MSESDLLRRGSISKSVLVQTILELRKEKEDTSQSCTTSALENILSRKLDPMMKKLETISDTIGKLQTRVDNLQAECAELKKSNALEREEICREATERLYRRKYLILSGAPEQKSGTGDDRRMADAKLIVAVAEAAGVKDFDIQPSDVSRIGQLRSERPRLLRFKCSDTETRMSLLRRSRDLKNHDEYCRFYINPDQTKLQRESAKLLRAELKSRRDKGEDVIIKHGKIVDKSTLSSHFQ